MRHVNMRYSRWGLLGLLWALLSGALFISVVYAIYGTFVTDDFGTLLQKIRGTGFVWLLGLMELVAVVGSVVGLFILARRIRKKGNRAAAQGWLIILAIASFILFFSRLFTRGFIIIKEGVISHALLLSAIEEPVLIIFLLLLLVVLLSVINRGSGQGIFFTAFSGTIIWTLGFGSYSLLDYLGMEALAWVGPVVLFVSSS